MSKQTLSLLNSANLASTLSSGINQALAAQNATLELDCSKGGEDLKKQVQTVLNRPPIKKLYVRQSTAPKDPFRVIVTLR